MSGRKVTGVFRSLVNARGLKLECTRLLHEALLVPVLLYGSKTMVSEKRKGLGLGLRRWTASEACWLIGELIEC